MAFGGIEILARLSTGGMGEVLLGRRKGALGFEKLLAIKTIRGDLVERADFRAMFLDEARLVARLDHPTICQVYDFGEEGKLLFITMEYVAGVSLSQLLRAGRAPMPPAVAARIVADIGRGLHYAHEATDLSGQPLGVVHRDVSPQNLLLTFDGRMKILDFGIAITKDREAPDTQVGVLKGKPSYMAPEHLRGGVVDRRADIFSCGVVLHEILTGRKLFTRETALATALAVESDPIEPPSAFVEGLHPELDSIVMRCLARAPGDRYPDTKQLAEALERVAQQAHPQTVQEYVELELAEQRLLHQTWLNEVLDRAEQGLIEEVQVEAVAAGLPFASEALPGPPPEARVLPQVEPRPRPSLAPGDNTGFSTVMMRRSGRKPVAIAMSVIAAVLLGAAFYLGSGDDPRNASAEIEVSPLPSPMPRVELGVASATISTGREAVADLRESAPVIESAREPVRSDDDRHRAAAKRKPRQDGRKDDRDPAPKEAVTPEPSGFGFLTVGAEPYALVRIDGADVGVTPIVRKKLPAGRHHLELVSPDTGEVRLKRSITLDAETHERVTWP